MSKRKTAQIHPSTPALMKAAQKLAALALQGMEGRKVSPAKVLMVCGQLVEELREQNGTRGSVRAFAVPKNVQPMKMQIAAP